MIEGLLFVVVFALIFVVLGFSKTCSALLLVLIFGYEMIGSGYIPRILLSYLQIYPVLRPVWRSSNVIIVLGGGTTLQDSRGSSPAKYGLAMISESRVREGARLFFECRRQGKSCKVLVSGGDPMKHGRSEAAAMKDALASVQVPEIDIILEDKSHNTIENARFSAPLVRSLRPDVTVLVTSGFHLRRATQYFKKEVGDVVPAPSDEMNVEVSWLPNGAHFFLYQLVQHELAGLLHNQIYSWLGWFYESEKKGAL